MVRRGASYAQSRSQIRSTSRPNVYAASRPEFVGIVNYGIIGMIQLELGAVSRPDLNAAQALSLYDRFAEATLQLLLAKNHDYGEAWRNMRLSSMVDLILSKVYRTKQIEDHKGETFVSEGIDANYKDMVNYALFCLVKLSEN